MNTDVYYFNGHYLNNNISIFSRDLFLFGIGYGLYYILVCLEDAGTTLRI